MFYDVFSSQGPREGATGNTWPWTMSVSAASDWAQHIPDHCPKVLSLILTSVASERLGFTAGGGNLRSHQIPLIFLQKKMRTWFCQEFMKLNLGIYYNPEIWLLRATKEKPTETLKDVHCSIVCIRNRQNETKPITMSISREWLMKYKMFTPWSTNALDLSE